MKKGLFLRAGCLFTSIVFVQVIIIGAVRIDALTGVEYCKQRYGTEDLNVCTKILRDQGIEAVDVLEFENKCGPGGVGYSPTLNQDITWGEGVWGAGSEVYESGLTSGPYTIEQWAIHVLKNIAKKSGLPEAQMVTESKVISLVAWSKAEGGGTNGSVGSYNPLNTKLSHAELEGVNQGNAAIDANSQGYPDFDKGVEATTRSLFNIYKKRVGSALLDPNLTDLDFIEAVAGDFYADPYGSSDGNDVVNGLEDIFPGDKIFAALSATGFVFDPSGQNQNDGIGDRELYVSIKRATLQDAKDDYARLAGQLLDSFGQQPPPAGTPQPLVFDPNGTGNVRPYDGGACRQTDGAGGVVNTEGYAFPLAPQDQSISGIEVGQTESLHWGDSFAFDLFSEDSADVFSIYSGVPVTVNTSYGKVPGCTSIQFQADDGFYYWYGHLKNPTIEEGVPIAAGVKMAEVADSSFGEACIGSAPHLHIDRGCSIEGVPQRGGTTSCRDATFIPFLSKLYEELGS